MEKKITLEEQEAREIGMFLQLLDEKTVGSGKINTNLLRKYKDFLLK